MKKILVLMLTVVILFTLGTLTVFATETEDTTEASYVAQVGETKYATIDEAIAAWTSGTTLTLLSDVTLSDAVTIKSTEPHYLNLGTYTMTAASGKNAFEIVACGTGSSERTALKITADAQNPGSINAGKKAVVFYDYSKGGITAEDRPIIEIAGGILNGSTNTLAFGSNVGGIHVKGTAARKCATVKVTGGTLNCSIYGTGKSKLLITGGTFNAGIYSQGDSTANRLISGGRFKTITFMTADSNNTKFWFGTKMGTSNVGLYVDKYGYLVVGGDVITEADGRFEASSTNYSGWSSYLQYSSAKEYGLFYETVEEAFADNNKATGVVTVYTDSLDLTEATYKGSITVADSVSDFSVDLTGNTTFNGSINLTNEETIVSVVYEKGTTPAWTVDSHTTGKIIVYADVEISTLSEGNSTGIYLRNYFIYDNLQDAINDAIEGDIITITDNIVLDAGIVIGADKNITIDLNGKTISYVSNAVGEDMITNNGTLTITGEGTITYNNTDTTGSNVTISTISNCGTLIINSGRIVNESSADKAWSKGIYSFTIDSLSGSRDATVIINGGEIVSNYRSLRAFCNSTTYKNTVEINGGTFVGQVWMQSPNGNANLISLTITGGSFAPNSGDGSSVYITTSTKTEASVTGGTYATRIGVDNTSNLSGFVSGGTFGKEFDEAILADGYVLESTANGYVPEKATLEDIITFKGYSISEAGDGVTAGYTINKALFEAYCKENGEINLGIVFAATEIDANAIYKSFEGLALTTNYNISLKDMKAEHLDREFVMALYLEIGAEKKFVTASEGVTVLVDAANVEAITYNGVKAKEENK